MTELIYIIGAAWLLTIAALFYALSQSAKERRELYNRLQAGTLHDYAVHKEIVEPPKPVKSPVTASGGYYDEYAAEHDAVSPEAIVQAQSDLQGLV